MKNIQKIIKKYSKTTFEYYTEQNFQHFMLKLKQLTFIGKQDQKLIRKKFFENCENNSDIAHKKHFLKAVLELVNARRIRYIPKKEMLNHFKMKYRFLDIQQNALPLSDKTIQQFLYKVAYTIDLVPKNQAWSLYRVLHKKFTNMYIVSLFKLKKNVLRFIIQLKKHNKIFLTQKAIKAKFKTL